MARKNDMTASAAEAAPAQDSPKQKNGEQASGSPANDGGTSAPHTPPPQPKTVTTKELVESIFSAIGPEGKAENEQHAKATVRRYLKQKMDKHPIASAYNLLMLYDEGRLIRDDANNIYTAVTGFNEKKPLLLVLHSDGGSIGAAYLIGKLLREYSNGSLHIGIPRRAKSAATLLCCAADHIHMGSLSELGPIDPQIDGLPALGLKGAIQHLAELVKEYPHATTLFSQYLSKCVQPIHLGYYERVAESAVQYAHRLLDTHAKNLAQQPAIIAKDLVYSYMDHGFVIDVQEARAILGEKMVMHNTDEYKLANGIYQSLSFISRIADAIDYDFNLIGGLVSEPTFVKRKN